MINQNGIKKVIFLGPEGSYCEEAKNIFLKSPSLFLSGLSDCEEKYFHSIKSVIDFVDKNPDSAGILPVENSIEGIVRETMDNLLKLKDKDLRICGETVLEINHCLISKNTNISKIKNVVSYTQALAQCQNSIHELFCSDFEFIESSSTSKAVKDLLNLDETYAAIGSENSAKTYGFNILKKKINDEPDNKTRFVMISREKTNPCGADKTSIAFSTKNEAGALVKVLNIFDELGINLCYIDSRPSKKNLGEYVFFADFEGHIEDESGKAALELIKKHTNFVKVFGSFARF